MKHKVSTSLLIFTLFLTMTFSAAGVTPALADAVRSVALTSSQPVSRLALNNLIVDYGMTGNVASTSSAQGASQTTSATDGHWTGTTSQGYPVSLDVTSGGTILSLFTIRYYAIGQYCGFSATQSISTNPPIFISNNQFTYSSGATSFYGQFTSSSTANGSFSINNNYDPTCGYYSVYATWSASIPTLPASFVKSAPTNGATNQPTNLTLSWQGSVGATSYEYCVGTTSGTCNLVNWLNIGSNTNATPSGINGNTTYYWQVRARNAQGATDADGGAIWNFTTMPCYTLTRVVNPSDSGSIVADPAPNCSPGPQYMSGTNVTLTANPSSSYVFGNWSGDANGTQNPLTLTMNGNKSITANFTSTALSADDFVITVKTDNPGISGGTQFTIPTFAGETYNYNVDCNNDGTNETVAQTGDYTCNYATSGSYTIRIKDNTGLKMGFPRIHFFWYSDATKLLSIEQWGTGKWTSMQSAFSSCSNLVGQASDSPDLSNVTDMSSMFDGAAKFNGNIGNWNVASVTNMRMMFRYAHTFNGNIGNWDTSNVTDMSYMFEGANAFNQNIGSWNTANVTNMLGMFNGASAFNQNIGSWNTANVTDMTAMFAYASAFNQNIGSWDVGALADAPNMFTAITLSTANYDALLNGWGAQTLQNNVTFTGGGSQYCTGEAARNTLTSTYHWSITDGGKLCATPSADDFVITVKTDNTGTSGSTQFTIPIHLVATYNYNVDCNNDGANEAMGQTGSYTCNYASPGTYTIRIKDNSGAKTGFPRIYFSNGGDKQKLLTIEQWGTGKWTSMASAFHGCANLTGHASDSPDLSNVTDMSYMFAYANKFNQDIGDWNTANATNMNYMFWNETAFNQDISNWNTAKVTSMNCMFCGANSFNQDIGSWDVGALMDATNMFTAVTLSTANYDALLTGWGAQTLQNNVTFNGGDSQYCAGEAARNFMATTYHWNITDAGKLCATPSVDDFVITVKTDNPGTSGNMQFTIPTYSGETYNYNVDCNNDGTNEAVAQTGDYTCNYATAGSYTIRIKDNSGVKTGFPRIYFHADGDAQKLLTIEQWGTGKWTSMQSAFSGCSNLAGQASDSPDLSNVTNMSAMFYNASAFNQDIGNWNTANVTDMSGLFDSASAFNQDIGNWNTSHVTDMSGMFHGASTFNQNIGNWDTTNVIYMNSMFYGAGVFNQNIGNWNTANVTTMFQMFRDAHVFNQPIGGWNTAHVTDMSNMFYVASAFNQNIGTWNTATVINMSGMFFRASSFNQPIGSWNTANVTDMRYMFLSASAFNQDIGNWNTTKVVYMYAMFQDASAFNQDISNWNTSNVVYMHSMFAGANSFNQNIGSWNVGALTNAANMFNAVTLSTANYDALLNGWGAQTLQDNVTFGGGNSQYCAGEAARNMMTTTYHWNVTDGGKSCFTLTYTAGDHGSISGTSPQNVNHGADGTQVTAVPDVGYHFVKWSDESTVNPRTDTNVTSDISVTASFAIDTYTLTYTAGAHGTISGVSPQIVNHGADGSLITAVADANYHFVEWSDHSTANPRTDTHVTGNISVTASFTLNTYTLTYTAGAHGSISGTSPQTVNHGADGNEVTAVADTGCHFVSWSDGMLTAFRTDTNVIANIDVMATFALDEYSLTVNSAHGTVTRTPDQATYHYGDIVMLGVTLEDGWTFTGWTPSLTDNQVTITGNTTITANYTQDAYSLTVNSAHGTVTKSPDQATYHYGDVVTLSVTPEDGWTFTGWTPFLTDNQVTIIGNTTVSANYRQITVITWANPANIVYDTALSDTQLNATANTPGVFTYTPTSGTVLSVGTHTLHVEFVPTDATNFTNASKDVSLIVTQATPVITWANPANIVYGTPLGGTQLNASANVPGAFTYNPASGTVLNAGTHTLHVDFTPTDTVNYANASKDISITVTKAAPVITWANPANIIYGTPLSATQLNATANTPGAFTYTPTSGIVLNAGTHTLHVDFVPTNTVNYVNASKDVSITVTRITPIITWVDPADIDYGTALSNTQLNATASVPGAFAYTPASGAYLAVGTHTLHADFVPTDTVNYANASKEVNLTVNDHVLFADVPDGYWARPFIERLYLNQITGGCGGGNYCPSTNVNRAMMAVFVLRAAHGPDFTPPTASGTVFADVPADGFAAAWIEQLAAEGITGGCGGGNYCPTKPVTRAQMAVFLVKAMYGTAYVPPAAGGDIFADVPADGFAAAFIEQLVADGITGGCGGGNFCPNKYITRAEMAVFLVGAFDLP